jgi:parvulin-like peptidyl-prolyl isomerase
MIACAACLYIAGWAFAGTAAPPASKDAANTVVLQNAPPSGAIARIGDETITKAEFDRDLEYRLRKEELETKRPAVLDDAFCKRAIQELVDGRIILLLAKESGIGVSNDDVNQALEKGKEKLGSDKAYDEYLKKQGLSEDDLANEIRNRLVVEKWEQEQTKSLSVTDADIAAEYERWKKNGMAQRKERTIDFAHILAHADATDIAASEAAHKKIEAARKRIESGESFQEVAKQVSDDAATAPLGGAYNEIAPGKMVPEIDQRIAKMSLKQVSEPFQTRLGWHILTVLARNEPGVIPMDKMKDGLKQSVLSSKQKARMRDIVAEARKRIPVEIYWKPTGK